MSANRSVQAAQRRRAGPTNAEPNIPGRGPQTSINSAQMFANQARSGQGPNIPTGRLAGQQAAMQQKQQTQQQADTKNDKLSSVSKMTIAQAITLITLRLGAIETKIMHMPESHMNYMDGEHSALDSGLLQSIMSRLESLEKRSAASSSNGSVSTPELNLFKQQLETIKQTTIQTKNSTVTTVKEMASLKTQLEILKKDVSDSKELLDSLQTMTMDNNKQILHLSLGDTTLGDTTLGDTTLGDTGLDELQDSDEYIQDEEITLDQSYDAIIKSEGLKIEGLKQLVKNELNLNA